MILRLWPLALIFYTDSLPVEMGGRTVACVVRIRPKYRDDEGLLHHELTHVAQWWSMLGIFHSLLYRFCAWYRLDCEVEAYKVQMRHRDRNGQFLSLHDAASFLLWPRYEFDITLEQAKSLLQGKG